MSRLPMPLWLLALPLTGACHVHVVEEPPPPPVYGEIEPNDSAWEAAWLGDLLPGDQRTYVGHASDWSDVQDGFRFRAPEPCTLHFELVAQQAADLDLCVYDPDFGEFVACFDSPSSSESGTLVFDGFASEFHLVVLAASGSADYTLSISVGPHAYALHAPAHAPAKARTLERLEAYRAGADS